MLLKLSYSFAEANQRIRDAEADYEAYMEDVRNKRRPLNIQAASTLKARKLALEAANQAALEASAGNKGTVAGAIPAAALGGFILRKKFPGAKLLIPTAGAGAIGALAGRLIGKKVGKKMGQNSRLELQNPRLFYKQMREDLTD
ncbi:MAG: hypothetical protein SVK08_01880 [Halobacteriota archaeon]|nr:hypothetical protein [Halobacteriota archaeon]